MLLVRFNGHMSNDINYIPMWQSYDSSLKHLNGNKANLI